MKSFSRMVLVVLIAIISFIGISLTTQSNAEAKSVKVATTEKSDWLIFVRVVEPAGVYIHIYTEGGVFITKYEEL